ncbi:unnamed protein product, partial [Prorocentrum cordatum]
MDEVPAEARPTASASSTPVASQPLAILDGSVAPPSPPPRDFGQQLRMEKAQSSGGADSVACKSQARLDIERALQAQKDSVNARSKKAEEDKKVKVSGFATSEIVEEGSRCDRNLCGIVQSEAVGKSSQLEATLEAEAPSKVGDPSKAAVEAHQLAFQRASVAQESRLAQWRLEHGVLEATGKKVGKQGEEKLYNVNEFVTSEVVDAGSCHDQKLDNVNEFGTFEVIEEGSCDDEKLDMVSEFATSEVVDAGSCFEEKQCGMVT